MRMPKVCNLVSLAIFCLTNNYALAKTAPLLCIDKEIENAELVSFSFDEQKPLRAKYLVNDDELNQDAENMVRWGHPAAKARQASLQLIDGSYLFSSKVWTPKDRITYNGKSVKVYRTSGKLSLADKSIEKINFASPLKTNSKIDRNEDSAATITLKNGDQIVGSINKFDPKELQCTIFDQPATLAREEIAHIQFAISSTVSPQPPARCLIGLADGSLLMALEANANTKRCRIRLCCGETIEIYTKEIVYLQPTSESIAYLSDLNPIDYRHTPYLSLEWPYGIDQMPFGGELKVDGKFFRKGISLHSASRLVYSLQSNNNRFQTAIALSDQAIAIESKTPRTAEVQILKIVGNELKPLFESTLDASTPQSLPVDVDITDARALVIVVDYGKGADVGDDVLFLDARLVNLN